MRVSNHPRAKEFQVISMILDQHSTLSELVAKDLSRGKNPNDGRNGMTGEQALRAAILYRRTRMPYRDLAFHLMECPTYRNFVRLPYETSISKSALAQNIKAIRPETWEAINAAIVAGAKQEGIDDFEKIRADTTVVPTNIHRPTDSSLLNDCVRVITRLAKKAKAEYLGDDNSFKVSDHTKAAKKLAFKIANTRGEKKRRKHYRRLIRLADQAVDSGYGAIISLRISGRGAKLQEQLEARCLLALSVIDQAERRVINGENLEHWEKTVSIFEPHTDIIAKKNRQTLFGHKITLTSGKSGIIADCKIERGNPADSALFQQILARHKKRFGKGPNQIAADGGFASKDNLKAAKKLKVKDCVFHKKCGLSESDMAQSPEVFRALRNFRAGIEAVISWGKRSFGLARCIWKGWESFCSYVMSGVVTNNLVIMARHRLRC
jgi:IS5 family transposase